MQLEFWNDEPPSGAQPKPQRSGNRVIRASEIGEYVYCHRAWWLGRVRGLENANRAALEAGVIRHRAHGQRLQRAEWLQRAAVILAMVAVIIGVLLIVLLFGGYSL